MGVDIMIAALDLQIHRPRGSSWKTPGILLGGSWEAPDVGGSPHNTWRSQQAPPDHTQHARMTALDPLADFMCGPHENNKQLTLGVWGGSLGGPGVVPGGGS